MNDEWRSDEIDFLREFTEVPDAAVGELHRRVVRGIEWRRRVRVLVPIGIAAALLCGLFLGQAPEAERMAIAFPAAPAAPSVTLPPLKPMPKSMPARAPRLAAKPPTVPAAFEFVRLETADPDVVIYLVADGGDE